MLTGAILKFIDEAVITVRGGKGGDGALSFIRLRYVPKGGPDGGNGGRGGDVILRASSQLGTLQDITLNRMYRADNGRPGEGSRRAGRSGKDLILDLPMGTVVWDVEKKIPLADLSEEGEKFIVAKGGRGGRGNRSYATSRNRAPREFEQGIQGEEVRISLELKLIADVGLVGRPNAGKSTLLAALTAAHPVIGDYPFSTLTPALGVVQIGIYQRIVIADIPGLAERAHEGRGLGHRFLRHIERTRLIVMLIEATETDYKQSIDNLLGELAQFNPDLVKVPRIVILSKADLLEEPVSTDQLDCVVSSVSGQGLDELVKVLAAKLGMHIV